ncbi:DUF2358 domain-containing protein [Altericista sp. CCNU0014]|uniref:DUF2358 domain-containing protein n=1 Tax=Altericista sp. CCNU0014 TaxID=3082949 RepID=UPI00384B2C0E
MDIVEALKADYARFPEDQTYELYAADVFFQDPLTSFKGVARYRKMIHFIARWFDAVKMELHSIHEMDRCIETTWTLRWIAPLPWKPEMAISGRSELALDDTGLVRSHLDYWDCSRLDVLRQLFSRKQRSTIESP